MMQNKLIVSNWKMNLKLSDSEKLVKKIVKSSLQIKPHIKKIICPQHLLIPHISTFLKKTKISLGAQDCHYEESGAYTGESSIKLLKSFKCKYVIIGHSERREYNAETNSIISKKIEIACKNNIKPIICIGESIVLRKNGKYLDFLETQLNECVPGMQDAIIAYEPIWSIGSGLVPTSKEILEVNKFVKKYLIEKKKIIKVSFLYGGSVSSKNIKSIIDDSYVDGALIGGSSLKENEISKIISIFNFY
jgi:triosephosphate isomerase